MSDAMRGRLPRRRDGSVGVRRGWQGSLVSGMIHGGLAYFDGERRDERTAKVLGRARRIGGRARGSVRRNDERSERLTIAERRGWRRRTGRTGRTRRRRGP